MDTIEQVNRKSYFSQKKKKKMKWRKFSDSKNHFCPIFWVQIQGLNREAKNKNIYLIPRIKTKLSLLKLSFINKARK